MFSTSQESYCETRQKMVQVGALGEDCLACAIVNLQRNGEWTQQCLFKVPRLLKAEEQLRFGEGSCALLRFGTGSPDPKTVRRVLAQAFCAISRFAADRVSLMLFYSDTRDCGSEIHSAGEIMPGKYRGVLLVISVPVLLICAVVLLVPRASPLHLEKTHTLTELRHTEQGSRYAVVLDAGSTGSRVHVFHFEEVPGTKGELKLISDTFEQLKPGLSAFPTDPKAAAGSLKPLLDTAMKTVPDALKATTPISLKATAGLRLLPGKQSSEILKAVTTSLKALPFSMADGAVSIMDGQDEGGFAWLTLNYLLGKLGGGIESTVAAIDLGGGSVQEAMALTDAEISAAPKGYVNKLKAAGKTYNVYVHSYLGYGLMAARAKLIETGMAKEKAEEDGHPCFSKNVKLGYKYAGKEYNLTNDDDDESDFKQCANIGNLALDQEATCGKPQDECSFSGGWRGKASAARTYYISSYFWDRAQDSGIISDAKASSFKTVPQDSGIISDAKATFFKTVPQAFEEKATTACSMVDTSAVKGAFPNVKSDQADFFCLDLSFCHTLLTKGFKLPPTSPITLVKQIEYNGQLIEAAWPLGAALNDLSS
eukprot:gene15739-21859_t